MDKFYILTNSMKDRDLKVTGQIRDYLEANGKGAVIRTEPLTDGMVLPEDVQCMICLLYTSSIGSGKG